MTQNMGLLCVAGQLCYLWRMALDSEEQSIARPVKTIDDVTAVEGTPLAARNLPSSTYTSLARGADDKLDKIALQFFLDAADFTDALFFTFRDVMGLINQAGNMFADLGVGPRDVVSVLLPNLPQTCFALWGAQVVGIANPIDPTLPADEMATIMRAAGTKVLVTIAPFPGSDLWARVASIVAQVPTLETILQVDVANYLRTFARLNVKLVRRRGPTVPLRVLDFGKTARRYPANAITTGRTVQPDDVAVLFSAAQAGSAPRLVALTQRNLVYTAWAMQETLGVGARRVFFCGRPLHDPHSLLFHTLLPWSAGASLVLGAPRGFAGDDVVANFWPMADFYKINLFAAPLPVLQSLATAAPETAADTLRLVLCEQGAPPADAGRQLETLGAAVAGSYGWPETAGFAFFHPAPAGRKVGAFGLRLPYEAIRIAEVDDNGRILRACGPGERGALLLHGPGTNSGNEGVADDDGRRWFNSGVRAREDDDGYVWPA